MLRFFHYALASTSVALKGNLTLKTGKMSVSPVDMTRGQYMGTKITVYVPQ